jgi:hypothetical protein
VSSAGWPQRRRQDHHLAHGGRTVAPDAGSIRIEGIDALGDPIAAKITAWLSDEPMIYDRLTPFEYLNSSPGSGALIGVVAASARTS